MRTTLTARLPTIVRVNIKASAAASKMSVAERAIVCMKTMKVLPFAEKPFSLRSIESAWQGRHVSAK